MVYRSNLQDARASVPPPPLSQSAHTPGPVAGQTKPLPVLALSGLALTQILWLTLQTCGQLGHGTVSGVGWECVDGKTEGEG